MPTATIKSPMVIVRLWSKTSGRVGSEARGSSNTALFSSSLSGMLRRKTTILKNANGMSRRGKAIRYMTAGVLYEGGASQAPTIGSRSGLFPRFEDLPAAIHAGLEIDVMGPAQFARILVLDIGRPRQR